ncbi:hypothetical protein SEA_MAGRITTE_185 [Microbacterium phage Magritte]|nr:hypothetical protein SEA_MAGRITTE_185 [Microbacterium phage Magritte]
MAHTYEDGARVRRVGDPLLVGTVRETVRGRADDEIVYVTWDDRTGTFGMSIDQITPELTEAEMAAYLQSKLSEATEGRVSPLLPHEREQAARRLERQSLPGGGYVPVHRPKQGGKTSELEAMKEDVQVATIAQYLHQAEKQTTSFTHNLGFHRDIARLLYKDGIRFGPEDQGTGSTPPDELPDDELPGMWEKADFMGGETEVRPRHSIERIVQELRRRANFPKDVPERAYLIGIRFLLTEAADAIERLQRGH